MKCLVLGGNGFIGSHLVDKLISEHHLVSVFDKYEEHFRKPCPNVKYYYGEFGNKGLLTHALDDTDIVFHLISSTIPSTSINDPSFDIQSNLIETINLLNICVKKKIKKIIFISSGGTVYGNPDSLPVKEEYNTDPICSYGIIKLAIEKYLFLYNKLYNLDYTILRPSNPYGERQNPNGIQGVISVFLGKIAQKKTIEVWGNGGVIRDYIYIKDLIDGIYRASIIDSESKIFNIGSGVGISINHIIRLLKKITGIDIEIEYKSVRPYDIPEIYLDISRIKEQLNWCPSYSLEQGIINTWSFVKTLYEFD